MAQASKHSSHDRLPDKRTGDDDETQNPKKRLRVSRACDQCRKRRDRCDGQQPTCAPCLQNGRPCTYSENTRKRGLPTGYVRAIETILGLLFRRIDGSENLVSTLLNNGEDDFEIHAGGTSQERRTADDHSAKALLSTWRDSEAFEQLGNFLSIAGSAEDDETFLQRFDERLARLPPSQPKAMKNGSGRQDLPQPQAMHRTASSPVQSEGFDMIVAEDEVMHQLVDRHRNGLGQNVLNATNTTIYNEALQPSRPTTQTTFQIPSHTPDASTTDSNRPDKRTLPPHWSDLLNVHFAATHCWFPISQKYDLRRTAHLLAQTTNSDQDVAIITSPGDLAFLWATLAYTSRICSASGVRFDGTTASQSAKFSSQRLFGLAFDLVSEASAKYEPGHLRALLMLVLYEISRDSWTTAWFMLGQAVYIASHLHIVPSLNARTDSNEVSDLERDGHRRVGIGCFLLDTVLSARLGRRPYLRRSDLQHLGSMRIDSDEEWESLPACCLSTVTDTSTNFTSWSQPGRILSTFNQYTSLVGVLNDIVTCTDGSQLNVIVQLAVQELATWRARLPFYCRVGDGTSAVGIQPQFLNLELAYAGIKGFLSKHLRTTHMTDQASSGDGMFGDPYSLERLLYVQQQRNSRRRILSPMELMNLEFHSNACHAKSMETSSGHQNSSQYEGLEKLIEEMKQAWCSEHLPRTPEDMVAEHSDHIHHNELVQTSGHLSGIACSPYPQPNATRSLLTPHSSLQLGYAESLDEFSVGSSWVPPSARNVEFEPLEATLHQLDDNELFRGLAMLDPVDWNISQPEFMSHLGFMSGAEISLSDFRS